MIDPEQKPTTAPLTKPFHLDEANIARSEMPRETAIVSAWNQWLTECSHNKAQFFDQAGLDPKGGIPSEFSLLGLYEAPYFSRRLGEQLVVSMGIGLAPHPNDLPVSMKPYWIYQDYPELNLSDSRNPPLVPRPLMMERATMHFKVHLIADRCVALNPVQLNTPVSVNEIIEGHDQEVITECEEHIAELNKLSFPKKSNTMRQLRTAVARLKTDPEAQIYLYPDRDRIAVAAGLILAHSLDLPLALPGEQLLAQCWRKAEGYDDGYRETLFGIYNRLEEFALSSSRANTSICRFEQNMELSASS